MNMNIRVAIAACVLGVFVVWITGSAGASIPDPSESCLRCLCHVSTNCDLANDCKGGNCGPFNISRVYWVDAGKVFLPGDEADRNYAWKDCANNYQCAAKTVTAYIQKFGKDCNGDGVTNCFDYMMLNANGGYSCSRPLNRSVVGRKWLARYEECQLTN